MYFYYGKIHIQRYRQMIFGTLFSLYSVDIATSKYRKFGYASMCGNI